MNIFSSSCFSPIISKPTRVTYHSDTLIDIIYCNIPEVSTHCKTGIFKLSIYTVYPQNLQYVIKIVSSQRVVF